MSPIHTSQPNDMNFVMVKLGEMWMHLFAKCRELRAFNGALE
jgi:hypothetical protein